MSKYEFARQALEARFRKAKEQLDPRTAKRALSDILSLPEPPRVPEDEAKIFDMICCIMSHENRNWLSISQVSLPHEQYIGDVPLREASLKSRVGLPAIPSGASDSQPGITEQMQFRRRFLDLVSMCIPIEERKRYPHILTLIDSHTLNTCHPPSQESSGVDAAAWGLTNYFSTALLWERGRAAHEPRPTANTSVVV